MKFGVKGICMVRCERFVIEFRFEKITDEYGDTILSHNPYPIIYDRVNRKEIIKINTGDEKLDNEMVEAVLTMLNIKFIGKPEETT